MGNTPLFIESAFIGSWYETLFCLCEWVAGGLGVADLEYCDVPNDDRRRAYSIAAY